MTSPINPTSVLVSFREFLVTRKWRLASVVTSLLFLLRLVRFYVLPRIAQLFLRQSRLEFDAIQIGGIRADGKFRMKVRGRILDAGPFPAVITTPRPVHLEFTSHETGERFTVARCMLEPLQTTGAPLVEFSMSMDAEVADEDGFGRFGAQLLNAESLRFTLDGEVDVALFGWLTLTGLRMCKDVEMKGMCGLKEVVVHPGIVVVAGSEEAITLHAETTIRNPSNITIHMGTVRFLLEHDGQPVGSLQLPDCVLKPGENRYTAVTRYSPGPRASHQLAGRNLLSKYLAGFSSSIEIRGSMDSCKQCEFGGGQFLAPAVATLHLQATMPGLEDRMVTSAKLLLLQTNPVTMSAPSSLLLQNPFDVSVVVEAMEGSVRLSKSSSQRQPSSDAKDYLEAEEDPGEAASVYAQELGTISGQLEEPWRMKARELNYQSPPVNMRVKLGLATLSALLQMTTTEGLTVDFDASLSCRIGHFETTVHYQQLDVPVMLG